MTLHVTNNDADQLYERPSYTAYTDTQGVYRYMRGVWTWEGTDAWGHMDEWGVWM